MGLKNINKYDMPRLSILICVFFLSLQTVAQESISKWKPNFQLDNRVSSIRNNSILLIGGKIGCQYKGLTRIGIGASFIVNPVEFEYVSKKTSKVVTNKVDFWYFSIYNDWILYKRYNFDVIITEQLGFGKPRYVREIGEELVSDANVDLYINELSTQVNYKINPIIGVGAGIGYRNLFNKKSVLNATFDAPIYMFKIIIYPRGLFKKHIRLNSNAEEEN